MSAGVYALLGALVGGGLGIAGEQLRWRREQHEREDQARRRLRQAARLINGDLTSISAVLAMLLEDGEGELTRGDLRTPAWDEYQGVLSYHLDPGPAWGQVRQAIYSIEQLRERVPDQNATVRRV